MIDRIRVEWFCGGMKQLSILITVMFLSSLALSGEVYQRLKVKGDYKTVKLSVENIRENKLGLTNKSIERIVKLRLLSSGIKVSDKSTNVLYVRALVSDVSLINNDYTGMSALAFYISLVKYSSDYDLDRKYFGYATDTGMKLSLGQVNSFTVKNEIEKCTDAFILDYLESNME